MKITMNKFLLSTNIFLFEDPLSSGSKDRDFEKIIVNKVNFPSRYHVFFLGSFENRYRAVKFKKITNKGE
jgi:hypothetical protein